MDAFFIVALVVSVGSALWAAAATWLIWKLRVSGPGPSPLERVGSLLFATASIGYLVHLAVRYPAAGDRDTLATVGVVVSFLAGLAGASGGPRYRVPLLMGGLGIAFLWYLRTDVSLVT